MKECPKIKENPTREEISEYIWQWAVFLRDNPTPDIKSTPDEWASGVLMSIFDKIDRAIKNTLYPKP